MGHINVKSEFGEDEWRVPLDNIAKGTENCEPKERVIYKMIKQLPFLCRASVEGFNLKKLLENILSKKDRTTFSFSRTTFLQ